MNVPSASGVKPKVEPQPDFTFKEVTVKSLEDIQVNISKNPLKITGGDGNTLTVFPRRDNLLFIIDGNKIKGSEVSIRHQGTASPISTMSFNERKQAIIKGHFSGVYVISIKTKN